MKMQKKASKTLASLLMSVLLIFSMSIAAFATTPTEESAPEVEIVSSSISSMGNKTVIANQTFPDSPRFVLRANKSVKLKVNVVSKSKNASGLSYHLFKTTNNSTSVAHGSITSGKTKTITVSKGGTYYFLFSCSNGSYVINYTITV